MADDFTLRIGRPEIMALIHSISDSIARCEALVRQHPDKSLATAPYLVTYKALAEKLAQLDSESRQTQQD